MKIKALRVRNVGPFGEEGCALEGLSDGLNVIRERNEAGKSTLFSALQMVLFEMHSSRKSFLQDFRHDKGTGAPLVELDIQLEDQVFCITKQYLSSPFAVVSDKISGTRLYEKRDAEDWISSVIGSDKQNEGPSGLLWVRQGESFQQPKPDAQSGNALFSLLEDEVDLVLGGQRTERVMQRAEQRLAEIATSGRLNPKGAFKDALTTLEQLEAERASLETKVRLSEETRKKLQHLTDELEELESGGDENITLELKVAKDELTEAKGAADRIRDLRQETNARQDDLGEAKNARSSFIERYEKFNALEKRLLETNELVRQLRTRIEAKEELKAGLTKTLTKRQTELEAAKAEHRRAVLKDKARTQYLRRATLEKKLDRARALASQISEAKARANRELPDLKELEQLSSKIIELEAQARTSRPVMKITHAGSPVRVNGTETDSAKEVLLSDQTRIEYQDLELVVSIPDTHGLESRLLRATEEMSASLASCGIKDLNHARDLNAQRNSAANALKRLVVDLKDVAPDGIASIEDELNNTPIGEVTSEELDDLDALEATVEAAQIACSKSASERDAITEAIHQERQQLMTAETKIEGDLALQAELSSSIGEVEQHQTRLEEMYHRILELQELFSRSEMQLKEAERNRPSIEQASARVDRLETTLKTRSSRRLQLHADIGNLQGQLKNAGQDGAAEQLAEVESKIASVRERISEFEAERDALVLLTAELIKARTVRRNKFFAPVRKAVDPLLSMVLGNVSLSYDDALVPHELQRNGSTESLSRLSGGTREQIAVLTRLGFARVMAESGQHMPIILDDALVYSDDERIQKLFDAINVVAADVQIIAFSCRQKSFENIGGVTIHPSSFVSNTS